MPSKSSRCTQQSFLRYCAHTQCTPSHVHTDGGKEFMGNLSAHLRDNTIYQTFTCPYRSFQNSIVERRVRSLKEGARACMLESGLPEQFYGRAMHTASVALNAHPTIDDPVHANTTPFAVMFPNRTQPKLRVFGSLAYVLNTPKKSRKDNLKLPFCILVFFYIPSQKIYCIFPNRGGGGLPARNSIIMLVPPEGLGCLLGKGTTSTTTSTSTRS